MRWWMIALTGVATAAQAQVQAGELPDVARPLRYRINLTVDPAKPRFSGRTEIDIDLRDETSLLYIHGQELNVVKAEANTGRMAGIPVTYRQVHPSGVAELRFARPLRPGRHTLSFSYDAAFRTGAEGLYRAKVGEDWYAWTQMEPVDARRMFPAFDEPRHKVSYTLTVSAPAAMTVVANTPEESARPGAGGLTEHRFRPTLPLPTYLVAIGVGAFDMAEASVPPNDVRATPLPLRIIATKGQRGRMDYALAETPRIVALLERYFGTAYPFEKLDQLASPIMGGAMENAGLITYGDPIILLDKDAPLSQQRDFGMVVAHEIAHQWFGNLVTPRWWDDLWLNESFAEWMGHRIANEWRPDIGTRPAQIDEALTAMDGDSRAVGRPIRQPIATTDQIGAAFDNITYSKGGHVIGMFERFIGSEPFQRGVRLHLQRHARGNATADQFFQSIAEGSGNAEIAPAWRSFVDSQGVPYVRFSGGPGSYTLTQSRYRPIGVVYAGDDPVYRVPVCASSGEGRQCTLMEGREDVLRPVIGTAPWMSGNADGAGYYRYDLPEAEWNRLLRAGATLPAGDAMAAADSLWAGFVAGRVPFSRTLQGARAFAGHSERLAALQIPLKLLELDGRIIRDADRAGFAALLRSLSAPRLAELGLDPKRGRYAQEEPGRRRLRVSLASLAALYGEEPALRATLRAAAEATLAGQGDALDPEFRQTAFVIAARDGGAAVQDRLFEALATSSDPLFRRHAAGALASVVTRGEAERLIARFADPRLQSFEKLRMLQTMAFQPQGRAVALSWIETNFPRYQELAQGQLSSATQIAGQGCSEAEAQQVDRIFRPRLAEINMSPLELDRPLAAVRQCAALDAAKGAEIRRGLR